MRPISLTSQAPKRKKSETKKKKVDPEYKQYDLRLAERFSLCDAMRYGECSAGLDVEDRLTRSNMI